MTKSTCDGDVYIHNLSTFIKSHERQLANALLAYKKLSTKETVKSNEQVMNAKDPKDPKDESDSNDTKVETSKNSEQGQSNENNSNKEQTHTLNEEKRADSTVTVDEDDNLTKEMAKPVRLSLSLHHLYFILGKFKELGITVGPLNLRLDNMDSENSTNYVSFLSEFQRNKKLDTDTQSIHSISSVKSVMSSVSALWNNFGSTSKIDNTGSDLKYLFSAFSKLPCLRLANEPNAKLIEGHEEYPFETATPIVIFKNLLVLELADLEPKEIYGWHILSSKLRYLVVKKAHISDPLEVLVTLVTADGAVKTEEDYATEQEDNNVDDNHNYLNFDNLNNGGTSKLTKSKSNTSDSSMGEKHTHKYSLSSSNIPTSYSSLNLASNLAKNHASPTLQQSSSFNSPYQNHHTYNYSHNYINQNLSFNHHFQHNHSYSHNHNYNPHHQHQHQISTDTLSGFSTSPTPPLSANHNRLYVEDAISGSQQPSLSSSVHSTRRSYYYKPAKKSRRSRNSTSIAVNPFTSQHASTSSIKTYYEPNDSYKTHATKRSDEIINHISNSNSDLLDRPNIESATLPISDMKASTNNEDATQSWKLLKHLSFTENKIEKISFNAFDTLVNLTLLDLSYNKLSQIPGEPLSKLVNLKTLNLSFNKLTNTKNFPKTLKRLTILNLRGNKLNDLESIDNLSCLQKIDLRQNNIVKVTELKPLLLLNKEKVRLTSIHLFGNPLSKSRGYRIELFNLFNGVDYNNRLKIDGSRPGIFESRMLLDEKTAGLRFKNYMDESMISKMTASVSSMNLNLNSMINNSSNNNNNKNYNMNKIKTASPSIHDSTKNLSSLGREGITIELTNQETDSRESITPLHPVLDQMSTSIAVDGSVGKRIAISPTVRSSLQSITRDKRNQVDERVFEHSSVLMASPEIPTGNLPNLKMPSPTVSKPVTFTHFNPATTTTTTTAVEQNVTSSSDHGIIAKPALVSNESNKSSHNHHVSTSLNSIAISDYSAPVTKPVPHSQRGSNDFSTTSSIITNTNISANNNDNNPIARLSLASPALPVITQATTTTMSVTNITTSGELGHSHNVTPKSVARSDYFTGATTATAIDDNKENFKKRGNLEDGKLSPNEDYSSGLKISVL